MEHCEEDVQELRADVERQCHCYNEFGRAGDDLLTVAQTLRSQVPIKSSGNRAEGAGGSSEGMSGQAGVRAISPRAQVIRLGAPVASLGGPGDGPRARVADVVRVSRVHLYLLFMLEELYYSFINNKNVTFLT